MEQWRTKLRELGDKWFEGELTVPKTELWLVLISCFLMGILYGLRKAPLTHGVMIGCGNGCGNGNSAHCGLGVRKKASDEKAGQEEAAETQAQECRSSRKKCDRKKHGGKRRR